VRDVLINQTNLLKATIGGGVPSCAKRMWDGKLVPLAQTPTSFRARES